MVPQGTYASARQQHHSGHNGSSGGQRRLLEGGDAPPGAVQQYPLARPQQQLGVLSTTVDGIHNAGHGAGGNLAAVNVEEALANIWALEVADAAALDGGVSLSLPTPLCLKTGGALLEIRGGQLHLQQCRSPDNAHGHRACGPLSLENGTKAGISREGGLGLCSFATQLLSQHPLHQQQLQNQYGDGMPAYPMANEQQRYGRLIGIGDQDYLKARNSALATDSSGSGAKTASNYCTGGLGFGGGDWGGGLAGGQMGAGSPKSSISSDVSGGDMVGYSPAAVWEVDMHRGSSKGGGGGGGEGGGGGGSGGGGRKRALEAADEHAVGLWQPQMIKSSESSARLPDREQGIDALKQHFLCCDMELESPPAGDLEEMSNKEEKKVKQLLQLLRITSLERDEARDQYQKLLDKFEQPSPLEQSSAAHLYPDPLLIGRTRPKFDSPSQAHGFHPYLSSPVGTLFDPLSFPELPHKVTADTGHTAMAQSQAPPQECAGAVPLGEAELDPASAIIDRLVLKRALPEKGKLLQAVMEAGPLLQTLLVAGSLPRWRNPPPLQPFQIPPVSVRGCESGILGQNAVLNQNFLVQSSPKTFQHQNSLVATQIYAASSLGSSGLSPFGLRGATPSACASSYQGPLGKRQKF